jgi:nicotinic acid mononucleotide adenylyltransferase
MKNYKQLLEGLPSKTVVFAFGRFNPPSIGHELLIKVVKKVASTYKAEYVIYASKTQDKKKNPLNVDRKIHYLNIMFPGTHFLAANDKVRTPIEAAKALNKKFKNLIMIAGGDRVQDFTKLLNQYNGKEYKFDSIQVISAGERDPDSDEVSGMSATKMRAAATKGDYVAFKSGLPSSVRDIDGKLLMNDIRQAMGQEVIKEQINLVKDDLREQYFRGEIFNVGDIVESNNELYEIVKRGSNHLLLKEQSGNLISKWIQDVTATQGKEMNEDLTDKTIKPNDKLKVARIIAAFLGVESPESIANPEQIVNMGLRKAHAKTLHADSVAMLNKMMNLADEVGIKYDSKLLPKQVKESIDSRVTIDPKSGYNAAKDILRYSDFKKLLKMNKGEVSEQAEVLPAKLAKSKPDVKPEDDVNQNDYDDKVASDIPDDRFITYDAPNAAEIAWRELENKGPRQSEVGHEYGQGDNSNLRRRKVNYQREEVEIEEDIGSADYKVNPDTGRKYRARIVTFANSKMGGKPDDTPDEHEDEKEYRRNNKRMGEAYNHASMNTPNTDRTDKKGDAYNPHRKVKTADDIERINKAKEADAKHTGLYKKQSPAQRKATVDSYMKMLKDIGEEKEPNIKMGKQVNIKADKMSMGVNKGFDAFFSEEEHDDMDETDLDKLADTVNDIDDVIDAYEDEELAIVDDETGEEIEKNLKEENETLNEVLSRMERIRAKARFARTSSKRQRATKIALKRHSNTATINKRARKLAVNLIKQRIARKPLNKLSTGEKERIEMILQRRKAIINRLAMKLAPRVRKIENDRLSHSKYTKK